MVKVMFSVDRKTIVTASSDGTLIFYSIESQLSVNKRKHLGTNLLAAAISRDGRSVVSGGDDGVIRVWGTTS